MKAIYIIVMVMISSMIPIACNDEFLEKYPLDKVTDNNFWQTAADVELFANTFYPVLQTQLPTRYFDFDNSTDNMVPRIRDPYTWGQTIVPSSGGGWGKSDWKGIRDLNYALDRVVKMTQSADLLKMEAELRFFKAYLYVEKIKRFGDVPWLEGTLEPDSEDLHRPRDSRKTVVTNILGDIDFAIANLPAVSTADSDRITMYAALALKVDLALYEGTFRKYHQLGDHEPMLRLAVDAAEIIMNSNLFSVYTSGEPLPNDDYFNLFSSTVGNELKGNPESILVIRYLTNIRMHNSPRSINEPNSGFSKDFVETYLCTDGLPISLSPLYNGDAVFGDEFVNRDHRMYQSVHTYPRPQTINSQTGAISYRTLPNLSSSAGSRSPTGYWSLKGWTPIDAERNQNQSVIDKFVYRYGVILLAYAEAKAELGEATQEVLDKSINLLRDRVGMAHLNVDVGFVDPNWPDWEVPVTPLINEIRRERRIETVSESKRWDDLVRWKAGKLLENPKTIMGARNPADNEYWVQYPGAVRIWDDKYYLRPIPTQELALNSNFTQNPGW